MPANSPHVSDKALRDFAYRVIMSEFKNLRPGTTVAEVRYFVEQLTPWQLNQIYAMFFRTGMVT